MATEIINFYPRSPYGERLNAHLYYHSRGLFLSTLSLRRATSGKTDNRHKTTISIHALLTESDAVTTVVVGPSSDFYPRSPYGERPDDLGDRLGNYCISIHALLTESDGTKKLRMPVPAYFYPRSPYGERPREREPASSQSSISIHALLTESDISALMLEVVKCVFLSTLSLRRATRAKSFRTPLLVFLSTLSLRRATRTGMLTGCVYMYFYPRSPYGERLYDTYAKVLRVNISIHALLTESDCLP